MSMRMYGGRWIGRITDMERENDVEKEYKAKVKRYSVTYFVSEHDLLIILSPLSDTLLRSLSLSLALLGIYFVL